MSDDLEEFINRNQKYVSLQDGESWKGIYQGYSIGINSFGNETVFWKFKPVGGNNIVTWQNATPRVALTMKKYKQGDCLEIKRQGSKENPPTRYDIEPSTPF